MKPYAVMRGILDKLDRDVVFSLCQYGWGNVWEWGDEVGGNLWRTTGDITDTWQSMSSIGFNQVGYEKHAGPGRWNDTDMLVVGKVGWGRELRDSRLSPNEQVTHITLWSLQAAPLLVGADMSQLSDFTIDLLGNPEVLAVNQDIKGMAASRIRGDGRIDVWARPLSDGTMAVGLFNRNPVAVPIPIAWKDLSLAGRQPVRDLWQHRDVGASTTATRRRCRGTGRCSSRWAEAARRSHVRRATCDVRRGAQFAGRGARAPRLIIPTFEWDCLAPLPHDPRPYRTLASGALLFLFGCEGLPSFPTAPAELTSGVAVFEHADYAGESALITQNQENLKEVEGACGDQSDENAPAERSAGAIASRRCGLLLVGELSCTATMGSRVTSWRSPPTCPT